MRIRTLLAGASLAFAVAGAQAALIDRGGGLVYDSVQDLTWLQDGNFAATSGHPIPPFEGFPTPAGHMSFEQQLLWAESLGVGGYTDWRLPRGEFQPGDDPLAITPVVSSELHTLWLQLGSPPPEQTSAGPFFNIQPGHYAAGFRDGVLAGPIFAPWGELGAFDLEPFFYQGAWAVRDGDVAAVPEPGSQALMLAGLALLGVAAARRQRRA